MEKKPTLEELYEQLADRLEMDEVDLHEAVAQYRITGTVEPPPAVSTNHCYVIPCGDGWTVHTATCHCRAELKASSGWTYADACLIARLLDGDIIVD